MLPVRTTLALLLLLPACTRAPADGPADTDRADTVDTDPITPGVSSLAPGDLIVTELMAHPEACADDEAAYLELLYQGDHAVDLSGLVLSSLSRSETLTGPLPVQPGDRVLLARSVAGLLACYGATAHVAWSLPLAASGDTLSIGDGADALLDELDLAGQPAVPGVAWERDDHDPTLWCPADAPAGTTTDLGSPGAPNGDCAAPADTDTDPAPAVVGVDQLAPGDLRITEFMANPTASDDTVGEYVEVFNTTAAAVDLRGLVVEDASTARSTVPGTLVVAAGARVLLARDPSGFAATYGVTAQSRLAIGLNNDGDVLRLVNLHGPLDEVDFLGWAMPAGASWSRDDVDPSVWCLGQPPIGGTTDLGTPGGANGACRRVDTDPPADTDPPSDTDTDPPADTDPPPLSLAALPPGALQIVEFMADPSACADPNGEYVELRYRGDRPLDLTGLTLRDPIAAKVFPTPGQLLPGGRVVLVQGGSQACYTLGGLAYTGLTLNNSGGDVISVEDGLGRTLDSVDYRTWSLTRGVAWEKDFAGRWCLADATLGGTTDRGSPGQPNGACPGADTGDTDPLDTTDSAAADSDGVHSDTVHSDTAASDTAGPAPSDTRAGPALASPSTARSFP